MTAKTGGVYRLSEKGNAVVSRYNGLSVSDVLSQQEASIVRLSEQNLVLMSGWRPDEEYWNTVRSVIQSCIQAGV
jgi:hypothetical protein